MDILNKPIQDRVCSLFNFVKSSPVQELHPIFPRIVENIFGLNEEIGWSIHERRGAKDPVTYEMRRFLQPTGPLLEAICSKLYSDSTCYRYEFPVAWLSPATRDSLSEAHLSQFFLSKVVYKNNGQLSTHLSLNAFEYYFFSFFSFIVHPKWKNKINWNGSVDNLYCRLVEDYFNYYLFLEARSVALLGYVTTSPRTSPIGRKYTGFTSSTSGRQGGHILQRLLPEDTDKLRRKVPYDVGDFWQTDTLIQIALEFWVNRSNTDIYNNPTRRIGDPQVDMNPAVDLVGSVRILVKSLYHFVYQKSCAVDPQSSHHQNMLSKLQDYKRFMVPRLLSQRLFDFLSFCVDHWPYDLTFKIVLEAWLTAIQPWRYRNASTHDPQNKSSGELLDRDSDEWLSFISEHYQLYATFLNTLLKRMQRMDLHVARCAQMLFRLAKVFSQPGLKELLMRVEEQRTGLQPGGGNEYMGGSIFRGSRTAVHSGAGMMMGGDEMVGGPSLAGRVQPVWGDNSRQEASKLIIYARTTLTRIQQEGSNGGANGDQSGGAGLFRRLWEVFSSDEEEDGGGSDGSLKTKRRLISGKDEENREVFLEQAIENLINFFDLQNENLNGDSSYPGNSNVPYPMSPGARGDQHFSPDFEDTDQGTKLTPLGRYQVANNIRRFDHVYCGDPDKQPVRSYELGFMVRITDDVARYFNTMLEEHLERWCSRKKFPGRLMRYLLMSPTIRELQPSQLQPASKSSTNRRSTGGNKRGRQRRAGPNSMNETPSSPIPLSAEQQTLIERPRISLRRFANYYLTLALLAVYLGFYWLGFSPMLGTLLMGLVLVLWSGIMCLATPDVAYVPRSPQPSARGQLDLTGGSPVHALGGRSPLSR